MLQFNHFYHSTSIIVENTVLYRLRDCVSDALCSGDQPVVSAID